jgi:hypothetical protein
MGVKFIFIIIMLFKHVKSQEELRLRARGWFNFLFIYIKNIFPLLSPLLGAEANRRPGPRHPTKLV